MRLELAVDVPGNVDEFTLSSLLASKNSEQGITITTSAGVQLDVDLVDVERVVQFIDDTDADAEVER